MTGTGAAARRAGIVEWDGRVRGAVRVHRAVADALGRSVDGATTGDRYALLDRARRHGWCADEWATVVPVLHDVEPVPLVPLDPGVEQVLADLGRDRDGTVALQAEQALTGRLDHLYRTWREAASPFADAPYVRVAGRVLRELSGET